MPAISDWQYQDNHHESFAQVLSVSGWSLTVFVARHSFVTWKWTDRTRLYAVWFVSAVDQAVQITDHLNDCSTAGSANFRAQYHAPAAPPSRMKHTKQCLWEPYFAGGISGASIQVSLASLAHEPLTEASVK